MCIEASVLEIEVLKEKQQAAARQLGGRETVAEGPGDKGTPVARGATSSSGSHRMTTRRGLGGSYTPC